MSQVGFAAGLTLFFVICPIQSFYVKSSTSVDTSCLNFDERTTCHSTNSKPYRYYGTKTSYRTVVSKSNLSNDSFGDCTPQVFYLISRHATRYPDRENIEEMIKHLPLLRGRIFYAYASGASKICAEDIRKLETWKQVFIPDDDNNLAKYGEIEAENLAKRYKHMLPKLLDKTYKATDYTFEYTSKGRTFTTAKAFANGLFGDRGAGYVSQDGKINDKVLQFHSECKEYLKKCNVSVDDVEELRKIENGPFRKLLVSDVSTRLGFNVSYDEIQIMYRACTYYYAMEIDDAWCSVFSEDNIKVMEYEDDLDDYYKDSYGNKMNYKQTCPLANYILNLFRNQKEPKAVLQFSHAGAIKKIYAMFNLFRDAEHLKAEDLCHQQERKWRSSLIAPFNSNLAIVLLSCGGEQKIAAFLNEKPVVLGGCKDNFLCSIQDFYTSYDPLAQNCDMNEICCSCCAFKK